MTWCGRGWCCCSWYYEHTFLGGKLSFLAGKTDALSLIDDNAFANDSAVQFVGVAFVNNPVLYNEDEYAPIISATFSPVESLKLTALAVSSSRPFGQEGIQKSVYSRVFNQPLVAAQLTYSPKFGELEGNYRIYYFNATYDHVNSGDTFSKDGWGVGLSLDQQISPCVGLFARLAYHDKEAYDVDWFWSAGANFKKVIPSRDEDALGIGIAGVKGHIGPDNDGTEFHAETYYRIVLNKYVALSPDFQWVVNPRGNSGNGTVFAGMLRLEMSF
jgi:carbohydrate-selective porin OprB